MGEHVAKVEKLKEKRPPYGVDCESCRDFHRDWRTCAGVIAKYKNLHDAIVGGVHLEKEEIPANDRCLFRPVSLERVQEFYDFLTGQVPANIKIPPRMTPKLSKRMAFTIVWFLQEQTQVFPDTYEQCRKCRELYNTENDGYEGKCDGCTNVR